MEQNNCECSEHGTRPATYVCRHIADAACEGRTVGFVCYPASEEDLYADAWCEACEEFVQARGGQWVDDEVEVPGGLAVLCSECYLDARAKAADEGRLHVL